MFLSPEFYTSMDTPRLFICFGAYSANRICCLLRHLAYPIVHARIFETNFLQILLLILYTRREPRRPKHGHDSDDERTKKRADSAKLKLWTSRKTWLRPAKNTSKEKTNNPKIMKKKRSSGSSLLA
jgi:hypothetical protein